MAALDPVPVRLGAQGRIVIPSTLRERLGIFPADTLVARVDGGRLVPETRKAIVAQLRARFAVVPSGVSLADELVRERRGEALREAQA